MNPRLKRTLWCRWFHRYHRSHAPFSVTSTDPSGSGQALALSGPGFSRTCCAACRGTDYGTRAYRRWLAS